jgi:acyl-coenzyme A thioesterase PaaI-like protein
LLQELLLRYASSAGGMRRFMNWWPPFRFSGIRVREIAPDFRRATVELRMRLFNRNYVGTHFGGSLFAMTDPFFMVMMIRNLGDEFIVWDKSGSIRFLKPARGTVTARIELPEARVQEARAATASGEKFEPVFRADIVDGDGIVVASVEKTLHIRRKKR